MRVGRMQVFWAEDWTCFLGPLLFPAAAVAFLRLGLPQLGVHADQATFWIAVSGGVLFGTMGIAVPLISAEFCGLVASLPSVWRDHGATSTEGAGQGLP